MCIRDSCTTGHTPSQKAYISKAALSIPIFYSFNTSLGIALTRALVRQAAQTLGDGFDIEIVETHHNRKVDAPSGTAVMLFDSLNEARGGDLVPVYDRQSRREARNSHEVGTVSYTHLDVYKRQLLFYKEQHILRLLGQWPIGMALQKLG